jgi:predicted nucleic acid-binding Zn ribbon protein
MYHNRIPNSTYGQSERNRTRAKNEERRRNMTLGIFLAPALMLGWFPLVWMIAKIFK